MFVRDLSELAFDRMSTEGAVERLAIGLGIAAPLIGALVAATGDLPLDRVAEVTADRDAMLRGAEQHRALQFTTAATPGATATTAAATATAQANAQPQPTAG
jgi:hypothetical protein